MKRYPILVHFEVTMRCNARCSFCDYWKTPSYAKDDELASFADAARAFNPMMVTFTGGEPTLRNDLEDIVSAVHTAISTKYMTLISHGAMLSPDRALSLWRAGINQFNISLDYLDGRHDTARGIPGLTRKILASIPSMRERGIDSIRFNTVIRNDNLSQLVPIANLARDLGIGVNFSVFTDFKNGNRDGLLQNAPRNELEDAIAQLLALKKMKRGVITSSDYYLESIPRYARGELTEPCRSGIRTIHISPSGLVRRCPDFPDDFHWKEFRRYQPISCDRCYYACRGEAQAPLRLSRIRDVMA